MFAGIESLRRAAVLLRDADEGELIDRETLAAAFREIWSATVFRWDWPTPMRERSDELIDRAFLHGPIDETADLTSEEEALRTVELIRWFVADAERLAGLPDAEGTLSP